MMLFSGVYNLPYVIFGQWVEYIILTFKRDPAVRSCDMQNIFEILHVLVTNVLVPINNVSFIYLAIRHKRATLFFF